MMVSVELDYLNLKRSHGTQVFCNVLLKFIKFKYHKTEVHVSKTGVHIINLP